MKTAAQMHQKALELCLFKAFKSDGLWYAVSLEVNGNYTYFGFQTKFTLQQAIDTGGSEKP